LAAVNRPVVLLILDGWGLSSRQEDNAIACAGTPNMNGLLERYPHTDLGASGEDVGLPEGQMGNSEVGHLNMGAGRVVYQDLTRISRSIQDGTFYNNPVLLETMEKAREGGGALHLMGLLSDGGVHSHISHLYALLELARDQGLEKVFVHAFLDGRDVLPDNAAEYLVALNERMARMELGQIATVSGRYYAMDRDTHWERLREEYLAMVAGQGRQAPDALDALKQAYASGETDEFVKPTVIVDTAGQPVGLVKTGDSVLFFNFRPDRAREITRAFVDEDFSGFERPADRPLVHFICMTEYDRTIDAPVAFKPQVLVNTLGEVLSYHHLRQLRLAETEKYAHVTFFFNGGVEKPNSGEDRVLIPSPRVATYDLQPEMSAPAITDTLLAKLKEDVYDVMIVNYANPDMVGHTGILDAAIAAVEAVDICVGRVVEAVRQAGGIVVITADHGNAEMMCDIEGRTCTAHTTDRVPFILVSEQYLGAKLWTGGLGNVAPTMLQLLGIEKPPEMTGRSLLE